MKIAYFDCFSGISGDMTVGALLSLGVDFRELSVGLQSLNLPGFRLEQSQVVRSGIAATKFGVEFDGRVGTKKRAKRMKYESERDSSSHRSLSCILEAIEHSSIGGKAKQLSRDIFHKLARAEAKVHNLKVEQVHFHEIGAVDSIVDIVGSAVCLEWLGFDKIII